MTHHEDTKFVRATKTSHAYVGQINGKTYVVPHASYSSQSSDKHAVPIRHAIVTALHHTVQHNPNLTPEELVRVHQHIKDIHGGQDMNESYARKGQPQKKYNITGTAQTYDDKTNKWDVVHRDYTFSGHSSKHALNRALNHIQKAYPHHKEHEVKLTNQLEESVFHVTDHKGATHEVAAKDATEAKKKLVSGHVNGIQIPLTQWHKIRVEAKALKEEMHPPTKVFMNAPENKAMFSYLKTKNREEKKAAKSERAGLTNRFLRRFGEEHIPEETLAERVLTSAETAKKEEIVKSMKKDKAGFKSRYGERAKEVMYATATKQAKKLAEESEQLEEAIIDHRNFMKTYRNNETRNRHTANLVHLANHYGTESDKAEAKFYADELKKHGHQPHTEKTYALHQKLWPQAVMAHDYAKAKGRISEQSSLDIVRAVIHESYTRKHFRQVADIISKHPDATKRKELASHHAEIFAKGNPRFDHKRFYAAANASLKEEVVDEAYVTGPAADRIARQKLGRKTYLSLRKLTPKPAANSTTFHFPTER
jgi:hypothetical protein